MPENIGVHAYNMWVSNKMGLSVAFGLNTARPQWISENAVSPGMHIKIIGKNMTSSAYGGGNVVGAVFVGEDGVHYPGIVSRNEFAIELKCPENILPGAYDVYISNDGIVWNRPEEDKKLIVTQKVDDVYNVGAAWVGDFIYDVKIDVTDYGATPNDETDDTEAIKRAIHVINENGGGIVYIPEGKYNISEIRLGTKTILAGAGMDKTILNCIGTSWTCYGFPVIRQSESGYNGICNLTLKEEAGVMSPDYYLDMYGHSFLENFRLDVPMFQDEDATTEENKGEGRGIGVLLMAESHVVIDNCQFIGWQSAVTHSAVKKYARISNNSFNTVVGGLYVTSSYIVIENNEVRSNYAPGISYGSSGIFTRGPSYIYNNQIYNVGQEGCNDGEAICAENYLGGIKLAGDIISAEGDKVSVKAFDNIPNAVWDWDLSTAGFNKNYLVITAGRGLGQYRAIKEYNEVDGSITLEKPFDVLPNKDSVFAVMPLSENVTMYKNKAENTAKGFWLFADCVDSVIAQNTGINTEGVLVYNLYKHADGRYDNTVGYFNRIDGNYFEGHSTKSNVVGISIASSVEGTNPISVNTYGIEIKGNAIKDVNPEPSADMTEAPELFGISVVYSCWYKGTAQYPVIKQIIIDDNYICNTNRGISITCNNGSNYFIYAPGDMTSNVIIGDKNVYENVATPITDERDYVYSE